MFLWDVATARTLKRWSGHGGRVNAVEFAGSEGSVVISGMAVISPRSSRTKPRMIEIQHGERITESIIPEVKSRAVHKDKDADTSIFNRLLRCDSTTMGHEIAIYKAHSNP